MTTAYLIQKALLLSLIIAAPLVGATVIIGLIISLVQAVMQLQEQSLPFGLKLIATVGLLVSLGPWMSGELMVFLSQILDQLAWNGGGR